MKKNDYGKRKILPVAGTTDKENTHVPLIHLQL